MSDHLLGLFLTKLELSRRQQATQGNLAELLLFKEFGNVHPHSQLFMTLFDLAEELHGFARYDLPDGGSRDPITRAKISLHLEV